MASSGGKSLRLSFKGEKPKKKRSSKGRGEVPGSSSKRKALDADYISDVEDVGGNEQAWVRVEKEVDFNGPCFLYGSLATSDTPASYCLSYNTTLQSVEAAHVDAPEIASSVDDDRAALLASNPKLAEELDGAEIVASHLQEAPAPMPQAVQQVWVVTKVPGSAAPIRYTLKSCESKFLGSDKYGIVQAQMEARGPQEEWTVHSAFSSAEPPRWSLCSVHGKYLAMDEVAGGKKVIRADVDDVVPEEQTDEGRWTLLVQWKHRHLARHPPDPNDLSKRVRTNDPTVVGSGTGRDQVLAQQMDTFKSRAGSKYIPANFSESMSKEERRALKKAEKEGRLAEEMLDRRTKMKSDKYA